MLFVVNFNHVIRFCVTIILFIYQIIGKTYAMYKIGLDNENVLGVFCSTYL